MKDTPTERALTVRRFAPPLFILAILLVLGSLGTALAATSTFYLKGSGVPTASLGSSAPSAGTLPNYDPGRDSEPGLLLLESSRGLNETDPAKYQLWLAAPGEVVLEGPATLSFWSAMVGFATDKKGQVRAYLLDCNSSGGDCVEITAGVRTASPWSGQAGWVARDIDLGNVNYTVSSGRSLAVKIVATNQSHDDMWFAYDTVSYPAALRVETPPPPTTTTTTTTTPPPTSTTSTTSPPSSTTTSTTTTTAPPTGTTTTTITTTTGPPDLSTTTTTTGAPAATTTSSPPPDDPEATTTTTTGIAAAAVPPIAADPIEPVAAEYLGLRPLVKPEVTTDHEGLSGALLDGLELVTPPAVASSLLSPLLFVESILGAFIETGRALLIPGLLLLAGLLWTEGRRRRGYVRNADAEAEAQT